MRGRAALLCLPLLVLKALACHEGRLPPCRVPGQKVEVERRTQCLEPPWLGEVTPPSEHWHFEQESERIEILTRDGAATVDSEALRAVQQGVREELLRRKVWYSSGSVMLAHYCATARCFEVGVGPCDVKMDEMARLVDRELEKRGAADAAVEVVLQVNGEVGPRCEPDDPQCGPLDVNLSQQFTATSACSSQRKRVAPPPAQRSAANRCSYDGECTLMCESCVRWSQVRGEYGCVDFAAEREPGSYCGCVLGECTLFRP